MERVRAQSPDFSIFSRTEPTTFLLLGNSPGFTDFLLPAITIMQSTRDWLDKALGELVEQAARHEYE